MYEVRRTDCKSELVASYLGGRAVLAGTGLEMARTSRLASKHQTWRLVTVLPRNDCGYPLFPAQLYTSKMGLVFSDATAHDRQDPRQRWRRQRGENAHRPSVRPAPPIKTVSR